MKKALYFQSEDSAGIPLRVVTEHKDGTVDLGDEAGRVLVTKCPVSSVKKAGHAVATAEEPAKEKAGGKR